MSWFSDVLFLFCFRVPAPWTSTNASVVSSGICYHSQINQSKFYRVIERLRQRLNAQEWKKTVYHLFKIEEIEESHQCIKSSNIHIGYWHLEYLNNSAVTRESASPSLHPNKGHINDYIIWWTLKYSCNVVMYSRSECEIISAITSRIWETPMVEFRRRRTCW